MDKALAPSRRGPVNPSVRKLWVFTPVGAP